LIILNALTKLRFGDGESGPALYWDQGTLQYAPSLDGLWTDLPAASPFLLSPIGEKGFFRVGVEE
jgi:hypothetical protein